MAEHSPTPVLILGGQENTLSVTRSLGKEGIPISVSAARDCWALRSRYCKGAYPKPDEMLIKDYWSELLLSAKQTPFAGHVILCCNDDAIHFVAENREQLAKQYILELNPPEQQLALLDKQKTLEMARAAGVPTPNFWAINTAEDAQNIGDEIEFPVIIKPIHSHIFQRHYRGKKYLKVENRADLMNNLQDVLSKQLQVMVTELIPGPDSLLTSYYTYHDENGQPLYHFTKSLFRRYPVNSGGSTYHFTKWFPETAEMGKKFFEGINLRGIGNIEFKYDTRDKQLKVIESNARFTAAQELVYRSGMDIAKIVYCHLTKQPIPKITSYKEDMRLLFILQDIASFRQLRAQNQITTLEWLKSLMHPVIFPYFSLDDPKPFLALTHKLMRHKIAQIA